MLQLRRGHQSSAFNKYTRRELLLLAIALGSENVPAADLSRRLDRSPKEVRQAMDQAFNKAKKDPDNNFFQRESEAAFAELASTGDRSRPQVFLSDFLRDWFSPDPARQGYAAQAPTPGSDGPLRKAATGLGGRRRGGSKAAGGSKADAAGVWGSHAGLCVVAEFLENLFADETVRRELRAQEGVTTTWKVLSEKVFDFLSPEEESSVPSGNKSVDSDPGTAVAAVAPPGTAVNKIPVRLLASTEPLMDAVRLHFLSGDDGSPARRPDNFLIASELTTAEELELFLLRATAADRSAPSHLINLERLHILCQKRLEEFLKPVLLGEQSIAPFLVYVAPALAKSSIFAQELESRRLHVAVKLNPTNKGIVQWLSTQKWDEEKLSRWVRDKILGGVQFHVVTSDRPGEGKSTMVRTEFHHQQAKARRPKTSTALHTLHLTNPDLDATQLLLDRVDLDERTSADVDEPSPLSLHLVIGAGLTFGPGLGEMLFRLCITGDVVESAKLARRSSHGWRRSFQGFRSRGEKHHVWIETSNGSALEKTILKYLERTVVQSPQALLEKEEMNEVERLQILFVRTNAAFVEVAGKFAQLESFHRAREGGEWTMAREWPELWSSVLVGMHSYFGVGQQEFKQKYLQPVAEQLAIYGPHATLTGAAGQAWADSWFPPEFLTAAARANPMDRRGNTKIPSFERQMRRTQEWNQEIFAAPSQYSERSILKLCIDASGLTDPTWSALMLFVRFFQEASALEMESIGFGTATPFDRQANRESGFQNLQWLREHSRPGEAGEFPRFTLRDAGGREVEMRENYMFNERDGFLNTAHPFVQHNLPGWERFMLQRDLLFRMGRDFATPSVVQHDMSSGRAGGQHHAVVEGRASWEESLHPYLFLTERGADPVFFGFDVEGTNVMRPTTAGTTEREVALRNYISPRIEAQNRALFQPRLFRNTQHNTADLYKQLRVVFGTQLEPTRTVEGHSIYPNIIRKSGVQQATSDVGLFITDTSATGEARQTRGRLHDALNKRIPDDQKALVAAAEALQSAGASKTATALRQRGAFALSDQVVLKLLALHKRLTMRIPIVLFGETGIGKTRMIDFLAQMLKEESYVARVGPTVGLHPDWVGKFGSRRDPAAVVAGELAKIENMKVTGFCFKKNML